MTSAASTPTKLPPGAEGETALAEAHAERDTSRWAIDFLHAEDGRAATFGLVGEARTRATAAKFEREGCTILAVRPQPLSEIRALVASMSPGLNAIYGDAPCAS